ncbi:AaceriAER425Wp [[Ashbya] aceris (nom. inval.)]|nr:AaceriAER425Wp [[Ashbya] aceris (nom. inval.)]
MRGATNHRDMSAGEWSAVGGSALGRDVGSQESAAGFIGPQRGSGTVTPMEVVRSASGALWPTSGTTTDGHVDWAAFAEQQAQNHAARIQAAQMRGYRRVQLLKRVARFGCCGRRTGTLVRRRTVRRTARRPVRRTGSGGGTIGRRTTIGRRATIGRRPTIRQKDFSTQAEIEKFERHSRFIFHKGFSRRSSWRAQSRRSACQQAWANCKFKTSTQLASYLNYIDLSTFTLEDATGAPTMLYSHLKQNNWLELARERPSLVSTLDFRSSTSSRPVLPQLLVTSPSLSQIQQKNLGIKRSRTCSLTQRQSRYEVLYPELYSKWREYLHVVVYNKIRFRLQCLNASDESVLGDLSSLSVETSLSLTDDSSNERLKNGSATRSEFSFCRPVKNAELSADDIIPPLETNASILSSVHSGKEKSLKIY